MKTEQYDKKTVWFPQKKDTLCKFIYLYVLFSIANFITLSLLIHLHNKNLIQSGSKKVAKTSKKKRKRSNKVDFQWFTSQFTQASKNKQYFYAQNTIKLVKIHIIQIKDRYLIKIFISESLVRKC